MSKTNPIKDKTALEKFKNYYLSENNFRNYALIILGLNTALRIGDILALKWEDVYNFPEKHFRKHICLTEQKTGKESTIAMNEAAVSVLCLVKKQLLETKEVPFPEKYLFTSGRNKDMPLSRYQAYRVIKKAAEAAGLEENVSCHSLRKTFGYYAWKQGVPPAMLMNIYNHSSYQITKRYLGIEQEDRDEVFMKIKI